MKKCIFFSSSPNADTFFIFGAGMPVVDAAQRENMPGTYFFGKMYLGDIFGKVRLSPQKMSLVVGVGARSDI